MRVDRRALQYLLVLGRAGQREINILTNIGENVTAKRRSRRRRRRRRGSRRVEQLAPARAIVRSRLNEISR